MLKSKKVLITGGAGYIGSWLVRKLIDNVVYLEASPKSHLTKNKKTSGGVRS